MQNAARAILALPKSLMLGSLLAVASCSVGRNEAFYSPYPKVSGAAGTVLFVDWQTVRPCTFGWVQCGERSYTVTGSSLEAVLLHRANDGKLESSSLARVDCGDTLADACDTAVRRPRLRLVGGELQLVNTAHPPDDRTIAWSGMRDFELGEGVWLCTAPALPQSADAVPLKIAPNRDLTGVGEVLFALKRAPTGKEEEAACVPAAGLPLPAGRPDDGQFLADALRDDRGHLQMVYLVDSSALYDWSNVAVMVATYDNGWHGEDELPRQIVRDSGPLLMPGFLDTAAGSLVMSVGDVGARPGFALRRYYRRGGKVRVEQPRRR